VSHRIRCNNSDGCAALRAVAMMSVILLNVTPCIPAKDKQHFEGIYYLRFRLEE
jgi:hypothetical protein